MLKATVVLFKIQGIAMFPLTHFAFVHKKCSDLFGSYLLFIDLIKKFGAQLVFLIFTDKRLPEARKIPEWKPGLRKKIIENMMDI